MLVLSGVISFVMLVSLFWWIGLLIYQKGNILRIAEMVIPAIKRVPSHWGFVTALVAFGLLQLIASIGITVLRAYGFVTFPVGDAVLTEAQTQQNFASMLSATLIAQIVTSFVVVGWAISRPGTRFANLSLDFKVTDIADGLKATVLLLPPVLMISGLVNHFIPYEHVVLESLKSMDSVGELTLVFATTAIVTPFIEELIFRVLLISGLENLAMLGQTTNAKEGDPQNPHSESIEALSGYRVSTPGKEGWGEDLAVNSSPPWWPVFVSSFLFAILHLGQGGAPIPLFFLAMGLGVLFRQTRRIWPVMIVHMSLNTMTLVATVLQTPPAG